MNKAELVSAVISAAEKKGSKLPKGEAEKVVHSMFEVIRDNVKEGGKVAIAGFGSFSKEKRAARNGVNPSTKERILIAEKDVVKFRPAARFLD